MEIEFEYLYRETNFMMRAKQIKVRADCPWVGYDEVSVDYRNC